MPPRDAKKPTDSQQFHVESGVPIPPRHGVGRPRAPLSFPFMDMQVGDSFHVPAKSKADRDKVIARIGVEVRSARKPGNPVWRQLPSKFRVVNRTVEGGVRCWRIE